MTEEYEEKVLICRLAEGIPGDTMVPGSIKLQCEDCEREVWCAPSGQDFACQEDVSIVCGDCGQRRILETPVEEREFRTLPGAAAEVSAYLRQPPVP